MRTLCLSFHAAYACAHSGMCCTGPWPIPVEPAALSRLQVHGFVPTDHAHLRPLDPPVNGSTLALATTPQGACVFFEAEGGRLCRLHRVGGADLLPSACQAFPRVALHDGRGLSITLSHYCPTAARLLLRAGDIRIVDAPDALSLDGALEGLDATAVLPPLLRAGMLMDLDGYARWEQEAIAVFDDPRLTADDARAVIRAATRETCAWRPGDGTLAAWTSRAFEGAKRSTPNPQLPISTESRSTRCAEIRGGFEHATKAFLAAHLFGSWAAYQQGGLPAVIDAVDAAHALVGGGHEDEASFHDAVRYADLRLRHG